MTSTLINERPSDTASNEAECERMNFRFYRDVFGGWRWEFRQADGHFIDSRRSYDTEEDCRAAARTASCAKIVATASRAP
jgi:uncharacterized protein YegP (UPF0339 family)